MPQPFFLAPLPGVLQNDTFAGVIHQPPLLDFLDAAKAADADQIIVQAAVSFARRLYWAGDLIHDGRTNEV